MAPVQRDSAGLGAEAQKLAKDLKLVNGELRLEKKVFEAHRMRLRALGKAEQPAVAKQLIALMLRLQRLKAPRSAIAVLQLLMLTGDLMKVPTPQGDGFES